MTSDRVATELRGFGPLGILAILAIALGNFVVGPPRLQVAGFSPTAR